MTLNDWAALSVMTFMVYGLVTYSISDAFRKKHWERPDWWEEMSTETVEEPRILGRYKAAELLGLDPSAMLLLQKDGILLPECLSCGKIYWKRRVLNARRHELRMYIQATYPHMVDKLITSE